MEPKDLNRSSAPASLNFDYGFASDFKRRLDKS
jgi:hypothetical protein